MAVFTNLTNLNSLCYYLTTLFPSLCGHAGHSANLLAFLRLRMSSRHVSASLSLSVVSCLLSALTSPPCQYHPELRHKGLSLLLLPPLLGPLTAPFLCQSPSPTAYPSSYPTESHPSETMLKQGQPPACT